MMTFYAFLIFLHVSGAVLMFVALGVEAIAAGQLREAIAAAPARSWNGMRRRSSGAGLAAIVTVLASGVWMMAVRWGPQPWIITGFVGLLVILVSGAVAALRDRTRIGAAIGRDQESSWPTLRVAAESLMFWVRLRAAIGIAALALMTIRPGSIGSILLLTAAVALVIVHRLATDGRRRSVPTAIPES